MPTPIRLTLAAPFPILLWILSKFAKRCKDASKESRRHYLKLPRKLSFTKYGTRFIALLLITGIAAINTGNNLLYLIVAMMMSFIIISGIMSESSIRNLYITRQLPDHIFAGKPAVVQWKINNKKRHLPSFSISIDEILDKVLKASSCYIVKINNNGYIEKTGLYTFQKRGMHTLKGFKVSTRFPFGFFLKSREVESPLEVIVYPSIRPLASDFEARAYYGEMPEMIKGAGSQIYNIRGYIRGDDSRFIHWKSTAKAARLMSKEFEREKKKSVVIHLNNPEPEEYTEIFHDRFESLIEDAASLASHFIKMGFSVGIKTIGEELPCRQGTMHLYRILRLLALLKPVNVKDAAQTLGLRVAGI